MLIEAARRVESAAEEMLSLVNAGAASCAELREMLVLARSAAAMISAAQTSAAATISGRERHGDGGAQVLADAAGLTRRDAYSQAKTAETLQAAPAVRDAVESGRVPQANAKRLAEAISKTSADAVEADGELLAKAASLRPDRFVREARRWTADRQDDGGEADYRRLRARRSVRVFDGDDGMVHLRGEFDPVTGRRIANRLHHTAKRLHHQDQQNASSRGGEKRNLPQCLADALDDLTAAGSSDSTTGSGDSDRSAGGSGEPYADVCVVAHVDDATGKLVGELSDGSRLPQSVLDELTCNAAITGAVFDSCGKPIWRTTAGPRATKTQRRILKARWGGCFHCRANFAICQPHHIDPVSQGGPTSVDNLVPACWGCHNRIHRDGWQIHKSPDGNHTLHPPQRIHHGPAHAPERPPPTVADPALFTALAEPKTEPEPPALFTVEPRAASGRPAPAANNPGTACPKPGREPPAAGQSPGARPGPAAARAALRNARTAQAARDGPR